MKAEESHAGRNLLALHLTSLHRRRHQLVEEQVQLILGHLVQIHVIVWWRGQDNGCDVPSDA